MQAKWTLNLNDFGEELDKLEDYIVSDQFEEDVNSVIEQLPLLRLQRLVDLCLVLMGLLVELLLRAP